MGKNFFDQFSLLHFASGVVAYFWGLKFSTWFILHALFEVIENMPIVMVVIRDIITFWPGGKHSADSFTNNVGDQFFGMLGWYVAYQLDIIGDKRGWYTKHIKN